MYWINHKIIHKKYINNIIGRLKSTLPAEFISGSINLIKPSPEFHNFASLNWKFYPLQLGEGEQ